MTMYEEELLAKVRPSLDRAKQQAASKPLEDQHMAELFAVGIYALIGICADIRRIADNAEI